MDCDDIDPSDWAASQRRAEILSTLPAERHSGLDRGVPTG